MVLDTTPSTTEEWESSAEKINDSLWYVNPQLVYKAFTSREAAVRREERARIAALVNAWHIKKGGYTELAHVITNLKDSTEV